MKKKLIQILPKHKLTDKELDEFFDIIIPICEHEEFKIRLDALKFPHHGNISLGEHIVKDALITYALCKKKNKKGKKVNKRLAVITAMFHDLYEKPWQNSEIKKKVFRNAHGFTHPIEASINAIIWYPEYFKNRKEAEIIIDGILHHMFPFPLRSIKNFEELELNNYNKIKKIDDDLLEMIIKSSNKNKLFNVSFKKSIYLEGKLVSKADKIVSMLKDITSFNALLACLTGKNPDLKK